MNLVILSGRLGKDAEARTAAGKTVHSFTLATQDSKDKPVWHNCEGWELGKVAEYLKKGAQVIVTGYIKYEEFLKDGEKKFFTKIGVNKIELIGGGKIEGTPQVTTPKNTSVASEDGDLPF